MYDPLMQQVEASMYMNPWMGYTTHAPMMSGTPFGYMSPSMYPAMQNQYGAPASSPFTSQFAPMYDYTAASVFASQAGITPYPMGASFSKSLLHMEGAKFAGTASIGAAAVDTSAGLAGGAIGTLIGGAMLGPLGALGGGILGSMAGDSVGGFLASNYSHYANLQLGTYQAMMTMANPNSPTGQGYGYSMHDARRVFEGIEEEGINDKYFSVEDMSRIFGESVRSGEIRGGTPTEITDKLKKMKETAKSLVEIFNNGDISEIFDMLRRLKATGLDTESAKEAARNITHTAKVLGVNETDYTNKILQRAATSGSPTETGMGVEQEKSLLLRNMQLNKKMVDVFGTRENMEKSIEQMESKFTKEIEPDFQKYNILREQTGYASKSEIIAISGALAEKDIRKQEKEKGRFLTQEERGEILRGKAEFVYKSLQKNPESIKALREEAINSGALSEKAATAMRAGNLSVLMQETSHYQEALSSNTDISRASLLLKGRTMQGIMKSPSLQQVIGMTSSTENRALAEAAIRSSSFKSRERDKNAMLDEEAGKFTKTANLFKQVENVLETFKVSLANAVNAVVKFAETTDTIKSGGGLSIDNKKAVDEALSAAKNTSVEDFRKMFNAKGSVAEMAYTGSEFSSPLTSSRNVAILRGMAAKAQDEGFLRGTFGDPQALLHRAKSGLYERESAYKKTNEYLKLIEDVRSGKISKQDARVKLSSMRLKMIDSFSDIYEDIDRNRGFFGTDYKGLAKDIGKGESRYAIESGAVDTYTLTKHKGKYADTSLEFALAGNREVEAAVGAIDVSKKIDFKKFREYAKQYGVLKGTDIFVKEQGLDKNVSQDELGSIKYGLRMSGGTQEGYVEAVKSKAARAVMLRSAPYNLKSALAQYGFSYRGGYTEKDVDYISGLIKKGEFTKALMRMNPEMTKDQAKEFEGKLATMLEHGKYTSILTENTDARFIGQLSDTAIKGGFYEEVSKDMGLTRALSKVGGAKKEQRQKVFGLARQLSKDLSEEELNQGGISSVRIANRAVEAGVDKKYVNEAVEIARGIKRYGKDVSNEELESMSTAYLGTNKVLGLIEKQTGKKLSTKDQAAAAMTAMSLLKRGENGEFVAMSNEEILSKYKSAREKKESDRTLQEQTLVKIGDMLGGPEKVTGGDISERLLRKAGMDTLNLGTFATEINTGTKGREVENLLKGIQERLDRLIDVTRGENTQNKELTKGGSGSIADMASASKGYKDIKPEDKKLGEHKNLPAGTGVTNEPEKKKDLMTIRAEKMERFYKEVEKRVKSRQKKHSSSSATSSTPGWTPVYFGTHITGKTRDISRHGHTSFNLGSRKPRTRLIDQILGAQKNKRDIMGRKGDVESKHSKMTMTLLERIAKATEETAVELKTGVTPYRKKGKADK